MNELLEEVLPLLAVGLRNAFVSLIALCVLVFGVGCDGGNRTSNNDSDVSTRDKRYEDDPDFSPDVTYFSPAGPGPRGFLDVRGLIHEHSPHSHDACDGKPVDENGNFDSQCLDDFYEGMCGSRHDFIMLTDHPTHFAEIDFPETLLFDGQRGDQLIVREANPVANRVPCGDGHQALILAGSESSQHMSVGIEAHLDNPARYSMLDAATVAEVESLGGLVLVSHTEDYTAESLASLPIAGFEMYNLHANLNSALADGSIGGLLEAIFNPNEVIHPDLVLLLILAESPAYLKNWAGALALGARPITTMGTDAHRNSLKNPLSDGERVDSWRRMNRWFSNHALLAGDNGSEWDDLDLKQALRDGRLYGVFELLGYARGFGFHARQDEQTVEMGGVVSLGDEVTLHVALPSVRGLDDAAQPPRTVRLLRATSDGWLEVASGDSALAVAVDTPGAYRAEVRLRPEHLRAFLGSFTALAETDFPWIYSNAIYITE